MKPIEGFMPGAGSITSMLEANFDSLAKELTEHVKTTAKAKKKAAFAVQFVSDIKPKVVAPPPEIVVTAPIESTESNPWEMPIDLTQKKPILKKREPGPEGKETAKITET